MDVNQFQHLGNFFLLQCILLRFFLRLHHSKISPQVICRNSKRNFFWRRQTHSIRNSGLVFIYFGSVQRHTHSRLSFWHVSLCSLSIDRNENVMYPKTTANTLLCLNVCTLACMLELVCLCACVYCMCASISFTLS